MFYGSFDRMPVIHWGVWEETRREWADQGLPEDANSHQLFNAARIPWTIPTDLGTDLIGCVQVGRNPQAGCNRLTMLYPPFPEETLEESEEYRVYRQGDGVVVKEWKHRTSTPHFIDYALKDGSDWYQYKKRLQPHPERIPKDINAILAQTQGFNEPIRVRTGSLVGVIRNWMGVQNLAYLQYDDRDLLREMVDTIADLVCWELDQILPKAQVDLGWAWEDICGNNGPLINPEVFATCVVPGYQKISTKLLQFGVKLHAVDSDGVLDALLPGWLEGGVNVLYPMEIGVWKTDLMALRKRFGRELRMIGGINKLELLKDRAAIDAEIERRMPLMRDGGYIPTPDHAVLPGTPLENYRYYLESIRALRL
jgi:uroporphyrinogen decarboxylase